MKHVLNTLFGLTAVLSLSSCGGPDENNGPAPEGKLVVHAVNYPLYYFTSRIAGDLIDLKYPVSTDGDPAFWEPSDADISALQSADLIIMNGASYSKWAEHVSLPTNTRIDTSKAFKSSYIATEGVIHTHGDGEAHSHGGIAFTTWLNMEFAQKQAEAIRDALIKKLPESKETLENNTIELTTALQGFDQALVAVGKALKDKSFVGSHPVYQYLTGRYKVKINALHWEPEVVPDDAAMSELDKILAAHPSEVMIWEGPPVDESIAKLDAIGIKSIVFNPCGNKPENGDFITVMEANIAALQYLAK